MIEAYRLLANTPSPQPNVVGDPVAWRWSFDGGATWCHGSEKPGDFRFGNPDIIEPLFALATTEGKEG